MASVLAYRHWALDHRNEFNLIFTGVLPGYAAPPRGPTIDAQVKVFEPIVDALAEAEPSDHTLSQEKVGLLVWTAFHGVVTLEVNNHLDWIGDTAAFYEQAVRRAFASVGLPAPAATIRRRFDRWAARHR